MDPVEGLRREVASEISRVEAVLGTQIGAVEKTLTAKIDGLKWKILGGVAVQALAAGAIVFSRDPKAIHSIAITIGKAVGIL